MRRPTPGECWAAVSFVSVCLVAWNNDGLRKDLSAARAEVTELRNELGVVRLTAAQWEQTAMNYRELAETCPCFSLESIPQSGYVTGYSVRPVPAGGLWPVPEGIYR